MVTKTPQKISQKAFQHEPSPKEVADQSKSSTEKGPKIKNSVNVAVQHVHFDKAASTVTPTSLIKKLMGKGESVCKLTVPHWKVTGTGFVLFDEYIMTSAHLFKEYMLNNNELKVDVKAQFYHEDPSQIPVYMEVDKTIIDLDREMDYAVLKLVRSPGKEVPPGLLRDFGPKPEKGAVWIIGHPAGSERKMDHTFIIEKEKRLESAGKQVKNKSLIPSIKNDSIMKSDHVITYDTHMFGGASGSPVFDEKGRVVGMHSAGVLPGGQKITVIEYARTVLEIYKHFVENLRNQNQTELLKRIKKFSEKAQNNKNLMGHRRYNVTEPQLIVVHKKK